MILGAITNKAPLFLVNLLSYPLKGDFILKHRSLSYKPGTQSGIKRTIHGKKGSSFSKWGLYQTYRGANLTKIGDRLTRWGENPANIGVNLTQWGGYPAEWGVLF